MLRRPAFDRSDVSCIAIVVLEHAHALRAQAGLRHEEGLHAAERGVCLLSYQLAPDQRLQLHQPPQRA
jgi:hypothetical protein